MVCRLSASLAVKEATFVLRLVHSQCFVDGVSSCHFPFAGERELQAVHAYQEGRPSFCLQAFRRASETQFEYRRFQIVSGISLPNLLNVAMLAATRQCNIRKASDAPLFTFYVYRAESDDNVP